MTAALRDDDDGINPSSNEYFRTDKKERADARKAEQRGKLLQFKRDVLKRQIQPNQPDAQQQDEAADDGADAPTSLKELAKEVGHQKPDDLLTQKTKARNAQNQAAIDRQEETKDEHPEQQQKSPG